ncbi:MAG: helix-turn-helix domain-containing protein [Rhizobiales bacterium]|nr:helix-turn-helix domain-containing protein [Hyphomicrobiales bacterium]
MALFFDQSWFDERLARQGKSRDDVAEALRLSREAVDEIFKDQRELSPNQVTMLARVIGAPLDEVVSRAGIATPMPPAVVPAAPENAVLLAKLEAVEQRLIRMERAIADMQSLILATRHDET